MAWLDEVLAQAAAGRNALQVAAASQGQPSATPTSTTGGTAYPDPNGAQEAAGAASAPAQADAALKALLAGYGTFRQRRMKELGPDSAIEPFQKWKGAGAELVRNPDPGATGLAQVAQLNTREGSARQGQAFQTYKLGGATFHVYYDKNGKRYVAKIPGQAAA
jgi:hypothetical protein